MSWSAPGSRYLGYLRSHSNGAFSSIFLKLRNYVRSECILIIYKFECNWNSGFVFINKFHELFAQPSYVLFIAKRQAGEELNKITASVPILFILYINVFV